MSDSITLHPKHGINAHIILCAQCNTETLSLAMLGINNHKLICKCGAIEYGGKKSQPCPKCKSTDREKKELTSMEPIYTGEICDKCKRTNKQINIEVITNGGVYFECLKCKSKGAIKRNEYAIEIRKKLTEIHKQDFDNPKDNKYLPAGIHLDKCTLCAKESNPD